MILAGKHAAAVSRLAAQQHIEGGKLIEVNFCRPIREIRLPKNRERHSSKAASTQVEMCRYFGSKLIQREHRGVDVCCIEGL